MRACMRVRLHACMRGRCCPRPFPPCVLAPAAEEEAAAGAAAAGAGGGAEAAEAASNATRAASWSLPFSDCKASLIALRALILDSKVLALWEQIYGLSGRDL
jgi:hypothetical protein